MAKKLSSNNREGYISVDMSTSIWKYKSAVYCAREPWIIENSEITFGQTGSASFDTLNKAWFFIPHGEKKIYQVRSKDLYFS